ncbi:MAG: acyl-CoA dehydrogenase family protein [Solirubrobacteraceae bacterium]
MTELRAVPTEAELVERALALRPKLVERQASAEELTHYDEEMHEEFRAAGFYRMFIPRRYGGFEVSVPTFMRVIVAIARGCPGTAWCLALGCNHALMVGSWFPERTQDEVFGGDDFIAAAVAAPVSEQAVRLDDGWELTGKVAFCSGIPYATWYMGQAMTQGVGGAPGPMMIFVAPRGAWRMLDDWGDLIGLKASGSNSIVFDHARLPDHYVLENTTMVNVDVAGAPGVRLHGNSMYGGRALGVFTMCLGAVLVGGAYNALDEYERQMQLRTIPTPPFTPRILDADFQRYFGGAWAKIATAEAALYQVAEQHMELCRRQAEDGVAFSYIDDMRLGCVAREVMVQCWETVQADLVRTAGASLLRTGERLERIFRDLAVGNAHRNTALRDWAYRELALAHFGMPSQSDMLQRRPSVRSQEPTP